jgi:hypothetical protein
MLYKILVLAGGASRHNHYIKLITSGQLGCEIIVVVGDVVVVVVARRTPCQH